MANLHRTMDYEVDGVMVNESIYPELQQAKIAYPIPDHAWFRAANVSDPSLTLGGKLTP